MSDEESNEESNEIPVQVKSEEESEEKPDGLSLQIKSEEPELSVEELKDLLSQEKEKTTEYELKLKHALADLQNLDRKTQSDIQDGVNTKIDQFMIEFLQTYDDFIRAKESFSKNDVSTEGLNSILKTWILFYQNIMSLQ